jgi:thiol-disulfide isomerase/thioredoxin
MFYLRATVPVVLLLVLFANLSAQEAPAAKVELQVVKYKDLGAAIRNLRGKVVVVDLWADWCLPCKQAFPHHVELHKRYAKDGLVCVSVALMLELDEIKSKEKVLGFLRDQNANFPNYFLEEEPGVWGDNFKINGPPAHFVFNRQGKYVKFDHNDPNVNYDHSDIEKVVKEFLAAK